MDEQNIPVPQPRPSDDGGALGRQFDGPAVQDPQQPEQQLPAPMPDPQANPNLTSRGHFEAADSALRKLGKTQKAIDKQYPELTKALEDVQANVAQSNQLIDDHRAELTPEMLERPNYSDMLPGGGIKEFVGVNQKQRANKESELTDIRNQIKDAKLDPARYWHNQGTMGNLMGMLSTALGSYGAAITHSPNFAKEIIDSAANKDWEAQKEDLSKLYKLHEMTTGDMDRLNNQEKHSLDIVTGSENLALQHKLAKKNAILGVLDVFEKKTHGAQQLANLQKLKADIQSSTAEDMNKLDEMRHRQAQEEAELAKLKAKGGEIDPKEVALLTAQQNSLAETRALINEVKHNPQLKSMLGAIPGGLQPGTGVMGGVQKAALEAYYGPTATAALLKHVSRRSQLEQSIIAATKSGRMNMSLMKLIDKEIPAPNTSPEVYLNQMEDLYKTQESTLKNNYDLYNRLTGKGPANESPESVTRPKYPTPQMQAPSKETDGNIANYARQYNLSYGQAAQILKGRGYGQ